MTEAIYKIMLRKAGKGDGLTAEIIKWEGQDWNKCLWEISRETTPKDKK